jgi:hypothetical protein
MVSSTDGAEDDVELSADLARTYIGNKRAITL